MRIGDDVEQLLDTIATTGATIPNSARWARIALITAVWLASKEMTRAVEHQTALLLCRPGLTKRMLGRMTASQIASASAASFFWRLR
jgi:hypothetical protein